MPRHGKGNENKKVKKHESRLSKFLLGTSDTLPDTQSSSSEDSGQSDYSDKDKGIKRKRPNDSSQNNNGSSLRPHPTKWTGTNNLGGALNRIYNNSQIQQFPPLPPNNSYQNNNQLPPAISFNYTDRGE